jgi:hypothetical protein
MDPKLSGLEQWRNIGKAIATLLLIFLVGIILFALVLELVLLFGGKPKAPEFTFRNVGPCLGLDQKQVERFEVGDEQYICADMETDEPQVRLDLYIFESENKHQVYVKDAAVTSGPIVYDIYPPLPAGKYWAYISFDKSTLVDFEFEVVERSDQ